MPIATTQAMVYCKTEATAGTAETIAQGSVDAIRVLSWDWQVEGPGLIEREDLTAAFAGAVVPVIGGLRTRIKLQTELYPWTDLTDVTSSKLSPLWWAVATLSALAGPNRIRAKVPTTYTLGTTIKPCTIEIHEAGGNAYKARGCVGTVTLSADAGMRVILDWDLMGLWTATPAASAFTQSATTYGGTQLPEIGRNATVTDAINTGTLAGLSAFKWAPAATLAERPAHDTGDAPAHKVAFLTRGTPDVLSLTVDAESESTLGVWAEAMAPAAGAYSVAWVGTQTYTIDVVQGCLRLPTRGTSKAWRQYDIEVLGTVDSAGDTSYLTVSA